VGPPARSAPRQTPGSGGETEQLNADIRWLTDLINAKRGHGSAGSQGLYQRHAVRVAISGMIGALYATMVIVFFYWAFQVPQVRVADGLMPLAFIFGYPAAVGLSIGCLVSNYYGFMVGLTYSYDVVGGAVANLVAAILGYKVYNIFVARGRKGFAWVQLAILVENIVVTLIVGSYMAYLSAGSNFVSAAPLWYLTLFIGSLVAMNGIGYLIYKSTYAGIL
jgi:uncharacterized membrane protein